MLKKQDADNSRPSKSHYYVVYDGAWKIQCDGENSEPYQRGSEAVRDAVQYAEDSPPPRPEECLEDVYVCYESGAE